MANMKRLPRVINLILRFVQCHELPGKHRFFEMTRHKYRDLLITHRVHGVPFAVPWDQWCFWLNYGPENYYLDEVKPFTRMLNETLGSFDFFDLGADVGVVSALINKYCSQLHRIYAFEPNPTSFTILQDNLARISNSNIAYNLAVSDFNGLSHFVFNDEQGSDHEGHLSKDEAGLTAVTSLDSLVANEKLSLLEDIAIKIDVEGQELATLTGARQVISSANKVILFLELHPDVLQREEQSPEDLFKAAENIRQFKWLVPLQGNKIVDRTTNFFDQFKTQQYDVIGISSDA